MYNGVRGLRATLTRLNAGLVLTSDRGHQGGKIRGAHRSWMRSMYSLQFGPKLSGNLLAHTSRGNIIIKSAAVGLAPPAKNPPFL